MAARWAADRSRPSRSCATPNRSPGGTPPGSRPAMIAPVRRPHRPGPEGERLHPSTPKRGQSAEQTRHLAQPRQATGSCPRARAILAISSRPGVGRAAVQRLRRCLLGVGGRQREPLAQEILGGGELGVGVRLQQRDRPGLALLLGLQRPPLGRLDVAAVVVQEGRARPWSGSGSVRGPGRRGTAARPCRAPAAPDGGPGTGQRLTQGLRGPHGEPEGRRQSPTRWRRRSAAATVPARRRTSISLKTSRPSEQRGHRGRTPQAIQTPAHLDQRDVQGSRTGSRAAAGTPGRVTSGYASAVSSPAGRSPALDAVGVLVGPVVGRHARRPLPLQGFRPGAGLEAPAGLSSSAARRKLAAAASGSPSSSSIRPRFHSACGCRG